MLAVSFVLCPGFWRMTCHQRRKKTHNSQPKKNLVVIVILTSSSEIIAGLVGCWNACRWLCKEQQQELDPQLGRHDSSNIRQRCHVLKRCHVLRPRTCASSFKCWKSASKKKLFLPWVTLPEANSKSMKIGPQKRETKKYSNHRFFRCYC